MKTITVSSSKISQTVVVKINNHDESETLTPALAQSAVRIAGCGYPATAWDHNRAYRVTRNSQSGARRLSAEEEYNLCKA